MDNATSDSGVIITGDLDRRPSRAPDYQAEAHALTTLAEAMSTNPDTMLQRLAEIAMELTRSDSAGISLLEPGGENRTFRWVATAGAWAPYRDGTMPREASPCGEVITREAVLLMRNPERSFPALLQAEPGIGEALLAPFYLGGIPVGTVWTIKHSPDDQFEAEDARVLKSLACFASAAQQTVLALHLAKAASQQAEVRVQQLVALAEISTEFFGTCDMNFMPIYGNAAAMRMVGLADLEQVKRTPLQEFFFPEDLAFITDEFFPRVLREGQAKVEIRFRHFVTGAPVWVDYSLVVLKDEMGRVSGLGTVTHDLTERKRVESALRVSEARFRALATVGSSSIYRMSPDWREMRQLEGASFLADMREESVDWVDSYIPPDERAQVREAIDRAIAAKGTFELEHRVLRADGTIGWTFSRAIPILDDAGDITEWFGAATDVTARVKADQSFTRLFSASPAPVLILKPDAPHFTIADVNDAYLSATMRTRDEVVGRGVFEAYPENPSDKTGSGVDTLRASLERVLASRQPDALPGHKYDIARPDGTFEERWWSPVNSAVLDDDGEVEALIHNAHDVTEERRAEVALRQSEERLQTLMNGIPQLVWRSCEKGLWTWVSPQWLDFTGQTQEQSQSMGWLDVIHPQDHEAIKLAWAKARPHGLLDVEYRVRRATDGAWIWHHTRSVPIRNEQERIVEWLGTSTDMQLLKELQERQGVLVAELQHRTRNLIAIVRSTSDKTARASTDLKDFSTRFRTRLDALARVQGLLSRLDDMDRVTFDELIKAELTAMDCDPDKVTLQGPPGIRLRSSTVQMLAMALHELATNALKYGALGQADARLAVTWRWESSGKGGRPWLHIEWHETGVNMNPIGAALRGTGQGRELIERALPYQLSAKTNFELRPDGVLCTISLPVSAAAAPEEAHD